MMPMPSVNKNHHEAVALVAFLRIHAKNPD
jgi:hypothetical protein